MTTQTAPSEGRWNICSAISTRAGTMARFAYERLPDLMQQRLSGCNSRFRILMDRESVRQGLYIGTTLALSVGLHRGLTAVASPEVAEGVETGSSVTTALHMLEAIARSKGISNPYESVNPISATAVTMAASSTIRLGQRQGYRAIALAVSVGAITYAAGRAECVQELFNNMVEGCRQLGQKKTVALVAAGVAGCVLSGPLAGLACCSVVGYAISTRVH